MFFIISIFTAVLSLLVLPLVLRVRRQAPPVAIVVFSILVAAFPLAKLFLNVLAR